MFTFGRRHEVEHAIYIVGNKQAAQALINVVEAVHDVIENKINARDAMPVLMSGLSHQRSVIWQGAGGWLRRLGAKYPELLEIWTSLAASTDKTLRYRVAFFLDDIPSFMRDKIANTLLNDESENVRVTAQERLDELKKMFVRETL